MVVRAKFRCTSVEGETDSKAIKLDAVVDGSDENKSFFRWTPSGQISISCVNEAANKQFEVGKEYYVDFTRVLPVILMCVMLCFATQLQAGQDCSASLATRVEIVGREPITPVRNILARISEARRSSCSGVERVRVERVRRVRMVSTVHASCSGVAAKASCSGVTAKASCSGTKSASCSGSTTVPQAIRAPEPPPQAYGLGIEAKAAPQPAVGRSTGLAQQKAEQQASEGRMRHVGGGYGGGRFEGVGWSPNSAEEAISKCCFYGQKTPREIGVARGTNGFFATVIY